MDLDLVNSFLLDKELWDCRALWDGVGHKARKDRRAGLDYLGYRAVLDYWGYKGFEDDLDGKGY